jgi:predicted metal-binding membrane protein
MQPAAGGPAMLLKRDRAVIGTALVLLTLLTWAYVLWLSVNMPSFTALPTASESAMGGMDMAGMDMSGAAGAMAPAFRPWAPADLVFVFAMWSVMMVGMMTPSVAPMILLYAALGRKASERGTPFAPAAWFYSGYLSVWIAFSAVATLAQWALADVAVLTPMMAAKSALLGGLLLVCVGLYQWTPLKAACLSACQAPLGFVMAHGGFRQEPLGAVRLGIAHGTYCLGCCFALMALLFVGGIMNVLWIAGLTILVLLEKLGPAGPLVPRVSGALIGAAGLWLLVSAG